VPCDTSPITSADIPSKAKLNSIHEVVLKNRLEQFKKRQREDAAKVQAEMGGVLVNQNNEPQAFGGDIRAEVGIADDADDEADEDDYIEEYDPEMSPEPADPRTMHLDERRLPIVTEEDEWRALVIATTLCVSAELILFAVQGSADCHIRQFRAPTIPSASSTYHSGDGVSTICGGSRGRTDLSRRSTAGA
jgi:hypothetical protein